MNILCKAMCTKWYVHMCAVICDMWDDTSYSQIQTRNASTDTSTRYQRCNIWCALQHGEDMQSRCYHTINDSEKRCYSFFFHSAVSSGNLRERESHTARWWDGIQLSSWVSPSIRAQRWFYETIVMQQQIYDIECYSMATSMQICAESC